MMNLGRLLRVAALSVAVFATAGNAVAQELLNVSYDPTRELWRDINANFIPVYGKQSGRTLTIKQSHGGSST